MFNKAIALAAVCVGLVLGNVIPAVRDEVAPSGTVFTDTKVIHTLVPTPPYLIDITTVIVWTQYPATVSTQVTPTWYTGTGDARRALPTAMA
ncbi:hypothetical protein DL96DRAFT_1712664 [Flagelloscypha sp. PMI_526]|nr:hypothetical protein DL96DRAFT_1712664 [Flagelloscypha sp. PMI_526]